MRTAIVAALLVVAGCTSTVAGYTVGGEISCGTDQSCQQALAVADDSFHPQQGIVHRGIHREVLTDPNVRRSGLLFVVIYDLSDGSRYPIPVYCGITGCGTI